MISLAITVIVVGILLYCVNQYVPMDDKIKKILNAVVIICLVFYLLYAFGVLPRDLPVPRVRG